MLPVTKNQSSLLSNKLKTTAMGLALAIALPIAAASFLLLSLLSVARFILSRTHVCSADPELGQLSDVADGPARRFRPADIDALTSNFSCCPVIGEGGFSTVYLATVLSSPVAVKVQNSSQQLHRAFRRELDILLSVRRHPNIVRLLGYCDERDQGVLVFDYVPNGTLHDFLHRVSFFVLPWPQRAFILFRVALALDHLHEDCGLQIVHGDVKSSNVLLGEGLDPKLCDFGSGRMGFSATVTRSATQMTGSLGYTDPHYLRTGLVSKKSDVYSFGVLILEAVTGIEAFNPITERLLTTAMRPLMAAAAADGRTRVADFVDRRLGNAYDSEEVSAMVEIAARCVEEKPVLRPQMAAVVTVMMEKVCVVAPTVKSDVWKKSDCV